MKLLRFGLGIFVVLGISACSGDFQKAEKLYQKSQPQLQQAGMLADPLGEAIEILEDYLSRNPDEPRATLLLWRCYLQAGHPRAQAMGENMRQMAAPMRYVFPEEIPREPDEHVREQMVYLFGEIAAPHDATALIALLEKEPSIKVQSAIAGILAQINAETAAPALLRKLTERETGVRLYVCRTLAAFPQPQVHAALLARVEDAEEAPEVRQQAAQSVAQIYQTSFSGKDSLQQQLEARLQDSSRPVSTRLLIALILSAFGQNSSSGLAMMHAESDDPFLRGLAILTLGYIGDNTALPYLTDALEFGNKALRLQAAEALGRLGNTKALPSLYKALDDPSDAVRAAANQSITRIKGHGANG